MTINELLIELIGEPVGDYGEYVIYVCSAFLTLFVLYSLLNLILTLFKWIWGKL